MEFENIVLAFTIFIITATFTVIGVDNNKFSVCGPTTTSDDSSSSLIFVTTLDGKISALDLANDGERKWSINLNEGSLISSSIHRRELNNDGHWVKLIPSLNGGLYKFNGESLEPLPVTTEQLLRSSYRYSDDLVFVGGKETRLHRVSSKTGKIIYQCNTNGCSNTTTDGDSYNDQQNILIIKRYQQTVRAIEPRTGQERWNYSVGQFELELISEGNRNCNEKQIQNTDDIELKAIVPEGIIWAMSKSNPTDKLWSHKFDSPIVSIWRENSLMNDVGSDNKLKQINLFDSTQWSWGVEFTVSPGLYIGMHDRQLYVQENMNNDQMFEISQPDTRNFYPWQPFPAIENAMVIHSDENENSLVSLDHDSQATALSILYNSEYVNGNGFYLFNHHHTENLYRCNHTDTNAHRRKLNIEFEKDSDEADMNLSIEIMISSLWFWWREVIIISVTTALLLNYCLTQRLLNETSRTEKAMPAPIIVEHHIEMKQPEKEKTVQIGVEKNDDEFKSRYLSDFTPINCLGKGGYGVVFEAKNKIDDCNYAIKRIALPNSKDSRERVMREVKALAKLDHHNIVRYFHAWLECPPAGWQEMHDQMYINKQLLTPSQYPTTTGTETETDDILNIKSTDDSFRINVPLNGHTSVDSAMEAVKLNTRNDDDSFIIFHSSLSDESAETEEHNEEADSSSDSENSKITNNQLLDEYNQDDSDSLLIVFQNSSKNSNKSRKDHEQSISLNMTKDCEQSVSLNMNNNNKYDMSSMSMNIIEKKKNVNKKSPKMFLYIQMQLCQRSSLREWLKRESIRDQSRIVNIFQQIVDAVEYVHTQRLIHRDLKPSNVFFAYDDKVKVGDFGLVTAIPESCNGHNPCVSNLHNNQKNNSSILTRNCTHTACVGTQLYMSPEQMNEQVYDSKVDIYSLGIILFELLTPFSTEMERVKSLINLRKSIYPKDFALKHPNEYNILKMMLDDDPNKRPTTLEMKSRPPLLNPVPWLSSYNCKRQLETSRLNQHKFEYNSSSSSISS